MEIRIESELFDPDSHFLFWKPGTVPYVEPDGMALRLDKGTDLVLNTHLQPSGKPETDRAQHRDLLHRQAGHRASHAAAVGM